MEFKKIIGKVKDKHNLIKEKIEKEKELASKNNGKSITSPEKNFDAFKGDESAKKGLGLMEDIFINTEHNTVSKPPPRENKTYQKKKIEYRIQKGDTLQSISEKFYNTDSKWILIHRKNIKLIENPKTLTEGVIIIIPEVSELDNFYPLASQDGNYIIQPEDSVFDISKKVLCSKALAKKLVNWNFLKLTSDIYPGKEIFGLKYLDLNNQMLRLADKYNINCNTKKVSEKLQKEILINTITGISREYKVPPVVSLCISSFEKHWMNFQNKQDEEDISFPKDSINWPPLEINDNIHKNEFPEAAMDIEKNIIVGIKILKKLKAELRYWPKTIASYNIESPIGIGKPEDQKGKAREGINFLETVIRKMQSKELHEIIKRQYRPEDEHDISFELLYKELIKYRDYVNEKYLL